MRQQVDCWPCAVKEETDFELRGQQPEELLLVAVVEQLVPQLVGRLVPLEPA